MRFKCIRFSRRYFPIPCEKSGTLDQPGRICEVTNEHDGVHCAESMCWAKVEYDGIQLPMISEEHHRDTTWVQFDLRYSPPPFTEFPGATEPWVPDAWFGCE
jgi:hypothetical protein